MNATVTVKCKVMTIAEFDRALAEAEKRGAVKALRQAADDWYAEPGPKHPLSAVTWIYNRANAIESGAAL